LEIHSKLIDIQIKEILLKILTFEIEVDVQTVPVFDEESTSVSDWQLIPAVVIPKTDAGHKYLEYNNTQAASIYAFESSNRIPSHEMQADSSHAMQEDSPEMQADSKASTNQILLFSILNSVLLFVLK
jgi:hypothetical protein